MITEQQKKTVIKLRDKGERLSDIPEKVGLTYPQVIAILAASQKRRMK